MLKKLIMRAREHIKEMNELGGMLKAIEAGWPKLKIEEGAARRQAQIDSGEEVIVGVNKYKNENEDPLEILKIDNTKVREKQMARLQTLKRERNEERVNETLSLLTNAAETGMGNLLELAVEAARARATLGEISYAIEKTSGRFQAVTKSVSGVYSHSFSEKEKIANVRKQTSLFYEEEGRRPRILIAKMGQDGHDRGAKVIGSAFADLGFDVDIGPLFQTPEETACQAIENDVHVIGMSSLAAGHTTLLPKLMRELKAQGREDIVVIVGGVIPKEDYPFLYKEGAAAIFGPGTVIPEAAENVLKEIIKRIEGE
jgi:methylmalonyl-CoA mutase